MGKPGLISPGQIRALHTVFDKYPDTHHLLEDRSDSALNELTFIEARRILNEVEKIHPRNSG